MAAARTTSACWGAAGKTLAGTVNGGGADTLDIERVHHGDRRWSTDELHGQRLHRHGGAIVAGFTGIDTIVGGTVADGLT